MKKIMVLPFLFQVAMLCCAANTIDTLPFNKKIPNRDIIKNKENEIISAESFYYNLSFHHAPIHYQDVDDSKPKSDYLTAINYDGNWRSDDNWNNVNKFPLSAHVYYSVVETSTHWFIIYAFFHPQDWDDGFEQEHENDIEGLLTVVRKTTGYGKLEAIITVAHTDFYSYIPAGSNYSNGSENIDGTLQFRADAAGVSRFMTCQEAKGHGLKAFPYAGNFSGKAGEDGIIYYPSKTTAEVPSNYNDRDVKYKLVSLTGNNSFWGRQLAEAKTASAQNITFNKWGNMKGNSDGGCGDGITITCSNNAANTPWNWDDGNDGPIYNGMLALDPAAVVKKYFTVTGSFSLTYTNNVYLQDLKNKGFNSQNKPIGWPEGINLDALLGKVQ